MVPLHSVGNRSILWGGLLFSFPSIWTHMTQRQLENDGTVDPSEAEVENVHDKKMRSQPFWQ